MRQHRVSERLMMILQRCHTIGVPPGGQAVEQVSYFGGALPDEKFRQKR